MFGERCANCPALKAAIEKAVNTVKEGSEGSVSEVCQSCLSVEVTAMPTSNDYRTPAKRRIILDIQPIGDSYTEHNGLEKSCNFGPRPSSV